MSPVENPPPPGTAPPPLRCHPPERRIAIWGPLLAVAVLATLVILGTCQRVQQRHRQEEFSQQTTKVTVNVIQAKRDTKPKELLLPGNMEAFQMTTIYPRANGYVAKWLVDIGDNVEAGQLLAEIETPEIDQQLAQARANFEIARVTAQRWKELVQKRVVAPQDFDEKEANYESAQASVRQLEQTQGFKEIVAPFAGKITSRSIDLGSLVSAGSGTAGTALFSLAQTDPLRTYVYVPQANVPSIRIGQKANIVLSEYPGRSFEGVVTRFAGALDPLSRTMQVEVQVPNHEGTLYAGMYGQVKFSLSDENAPIVMPSNVFTFRTAGPQVATVTNDHKIHWQNIQIGRDFGTQIEVLSGLPENAKVVMNPTDDLPEGAPVQEKAAAPPATTGQTSTAPKPSGSPAKQ